MEARMTGVQLRDYQQRMVDDIRGRWATDTRAVLGVLPTGGGKTEVAIAIVGTDASPARRVLIVVERKTLADQWVKRLHKHGIEDVGVLQGANTRRTWAPILVATAQTIKSRGVPEGVDLIVIDESHFWHGAHDDVLAQLSNARVLGLTATPLRAGLGLRFDSVVVGARIRELIALGHLVPGRYYAPGADQIAAALETVAIRAGDFATNELSKAIRSKMIIGDVVGSWQKRGEDRQTIAFCVDKQHARELAEQFIEVGVTAEVVVDDTPDEERARIFAAFDAGKVRVLSSVGVLSVGFDSPVASCAILARPTMSMSLYIQQGGRVLRAFPGKKDALILDHAGNTSRFGLLEEFDPPTDLSTVDKSTDKRKRRDSPEAWVCRACEAANTLADDICAECGEPKRRFTALVVLDGELQPVTYTPGEALSGPTMDEIRRGYLMLLWYGRAKAMRNPEGWAYHAVQRRFDIPEDKAKRWIAWDWRYEEPIAPDDECSRWLRADYQRAIIINRARGKQHA
jgi:DNA repair protein RadD